MVGQGRIVEVRVIDAVIVEVGIGREHPKINAGIPKEDPRPQPSGQVGRRGEIGNQISRLPGLVEVGHQVFVGGGEISVAQLEGQTTLVAAPPVDEPLVLQDHSRAGMQGFEVVPPRQLERLRRCRRQETGRGLRLRGREARGQRTSAGNLQRHDVAIVGEGERRRTPENDVAEIDWDLREGAAIGEAPATEGDSAVAIKTEAGGVPKIFPG